MDERKSGLELYCLETGSTKVDLKVNIRTHVFLARTAEKHRLQ
jgi:hypothetical protein